MDVVASADPQAAGSGAPPSLTPMGPLHLRLRRNEASADPASSWMGIHQ